MSNPNPKRGPLPHGPGHGRTKGAKNKLTIEKVENEIRRIAMVNAKDLFEGIHGNRKTFTLREIKNMPDDVSACISSIKVKTENLTAGDGQQDTTVQVTLWDKVKALEMCAKHFKWIEDKMKLEVNASELRDLIAEGRQRNANRSK
jgi:hypothetical protein